MRKLNSSFFLFIFCVRHFFFLSLSAYWKLDNLWFSLSEEEDSMNYWILCFLNLFSLINSHFRLAIRIVLLWWSEISYVSCLESYVSCVGTYWHFFSSFFFSHAFLNPHISPPRERTDCHDLAIAQQKANNFSSRISIWELVKQVNCSIHFSIFQCLSHD